MINLNELQRVLIEKYGDHGAAVYFREYVRLFLELAPTKNNQTYLLRALEDDLKELGEDHGS